MVCVVKWAVAGCRKQYMIVQIPEEPYETSVSETDYIMISTGNRRGTTTYIDAVIIP